jgi:hypothetical protein
MKRVAFFRGASLALVALSIACGDSTAPVTLTEAQVEDMLEAMTTVSYIGQASGPGFSIRRAGQVANATVTVSETVECPNGGSATISGTATDNPDAGTFTAQITQGFSACAATSEAGRVWTFNGNPNITTNISASQNQTTGAFSLTATQVGAVNFASDIGEGACSLNLTLAITGTATSVNATLSGTACGRTIQRSISVTE